MAVANPQPSLFGAVDEEQTAERPEGLPTQVGAALLVEDQHPQAPVHQFARGHQARESGPDDDGVGAESRAEESLMSDQGNARGGRAEVMLGQAASRIALSRRQR